MDLPPQPPPDVPAPPPGPEAIRSRKWKKLLYSALIAFVLIGILASYVLRQAKQADRIHAQSNLRIIFQELLEFESQYQKFPDDSTLPQIEVQDDTGLEFGTKTSNGYFRQMLATGGKAEKIYFANILPRTFYPDDITEGSKALEKDECSFSYIPGLSSSSPPGTPVVMTPLVPGTRKFNPKPFGKKATVLFTDGSVQALPIDKNGDVILNGMNLFDPRQPFWRGKAPDIKYPE
jgi:hypothetical protein